ncbi:YigZ family protein [Marinimicrobium sp. ABcell2]|uniref:IMPACT family protein n=1 Tax=Marinimicrobium sp. ABcell2 TaxID=3069751 RepID=UPI0027B38382|nr:YigZ family protein [Marinimicrobium sp. ABcell2]MDQ2077719.1 YigZ family protein [Marinimicrobium sp. ABcell2]
MICKPYQVLANSCEYRYEEKRSIFTALLIPVVNREQALAAVADTRRAHPGASHYCWAYILGDSEQPQAQAFSDDGEPAGTAGKPILNVLGHRRAGDCLAVVVRIFGGVKLGSGGLVRAYSQSVSQALDEAQWRLITPASTVSIQVDFAQEERVRHCLTQAGLQVEHADYQQSVRLRVSVPQNQLQGLENSVREVTGGQASMSIE